MVGEPLFLWGFDTADNMAIDTIWQNLGLLPKGLVLPNCMGFARLFGVPPNCLQMLLQYGRYCHILSGCLSFRWIKLRKPHKARKYGILGIT